MQIILIDGPKAGHCYTLQASSDVFYVAICDPIETTQLADVARTYVMNIRKGIYRARRIPSTGHICHDDQQRAIFEYHGER